MHIYRVGGVVRDRLLGNPVKDVDYVVVGSTPDQMISLGYKPVGKDFPVFLHPDTKEEYALARTERKVHVGYHGFEFNAAPDVTLEQDLSRRDLTINAMAENDLGEIIDLFGGQRDLELKMLRHVSCSFAEDPVRVLRAARFAARLDFKIADETLALMCNMRDSGELASLQSERVWQELSKAVGEKYPARFFQTLLDINAFHIIFPNLDLGFVNENWLPVMQHPDWPILDFETKIYMVFRPWMTVIPDWHWLRCPKSCLETFRFLQQFEQMIAKNVLDQADHILQILECIDVFRHPQRIDVVKRLHLFLRATNLSKQEAFYIRDLDKFICQCNKINFKDVVLQVADIKQISTIIREKKLEMIRLVLIDKNIIHRQEN